MQKAPLEKRRSNDAGSAGTVLNDVRTNEGCGGPGLEKKGLSSFSSRKSNCKTIGWEGQRIEQTRLGGKGRERKML